MQIDTSAARVQTPVDNFVLAGDWTQQKFLGSMEGAVLAGKLAAEVIASRAASELAGEFGFGSHSSDWIDVRIAEMS